MSIKNILLLIVKVILLLLVILIFSYVNTKDAHIKKMKDNMKMKRARKQSKQYKEGIQNIDVSSVIINEENVSGVIDDMVANSRQLLEERLQEPDIVNDGLLNTSLDALIRNSEEPSTEGFGNRNMSINRMYREKEGKRQRKKFFGGDDEGSGDDGRFVVAQNQASNGECKYETKKVFNAIVWLLGKLLFVLIWLVKAIIGLVPEKYMKWPRRFGEVLYFPIRIILDILNKSSSTVLSVISALKRTLILIISTIANIVFVFVPGFMVNIIAYFLTPFLILYRRIKSLFSFIPVPAVCWSK